MLLVSCRFVSLTKVVFYLVRSLRWPWSETIVSHFLAVLLWKCCRFRWHWYINWLIVYVLIIIRTLIALNDEIVLWVLQLFGLPYIFNFACISCDCQRYYWFAICLRFILCANRYSKDTLQRIKCSAFISKIANRCKLLSLNVLNTKF